MIKDRVITIEKFTFVQTLMYTNYTVKEKNYVHIKSAITLNNIC